MKNLKTLSILLLLSIFAFAGCKTNTSPDEEAENSRDYNPDEINAFIITYVTDKGTVPDQIALAEGAKICRHYLLKLAILILTDGILTALKLSLDM